MRKFIYITEYEALQLRQALVSWIGSSNGYNSRDGIITQARAQQLLRELGEELAFRKPRTLYIVTHNQNTIEGTEEVSTFWDKNEAEQFAARHRDAGTLGTLTSTEV